MSLAQPNKLEIETSWRYLSSTLIKRNDVILKLDNTFQGTKSTYKLQTSSLRKKAVELTKFLNTIKSIDKLSVNKASLLHTEIVEKMNLLLTSIEKDSNIQKDNNLRDLIVQLEGIENRIAVDKERYNTDCNTASKPYLKFDLTTPNNIPEVKF
jgi:LemA protein